MEKGRMERGEVLCSMIAQLTSPLSILPSQFNKVSTLLFRKL